MHSWKTHLHETRLTVGLIISLYRSGRGCNVALLVYERDDREFRILTGSEHECLEMKVRFVNNIT